MRVLAPSSSKERIYVCLLTLTVLDRGEAEERIIVDVVDPGARQCRLRLYVCTRSLAALQLCVRNHLPSHHDEPGKLGTGTAEPGGGGGG